MEPAAWEQPCWQPSAWDDGAMSTTVPDPSPELLQRAAAVRRSAMALGQRSDGERRGALLAMADALEANHLQIVAANQADLEAAASEGLAEALVARLKLEPAKLRGAIDGVRQVAQLADPIGVRQLHTELDSGLVLERLTVPLGVLGIIFEARPDAVMQIAALAIRSGNGALLKGGREAARSCAAIMDALKAGLAASAVDPAALELLTSREESLGLLKLDGLVDLIIPRGSNALVRFIQDNTRIPVLGHADGVCHLYVDAAADPELALRIALDSKTQYPAACNAIETLLVHEAIAPAFLPPAIAAFQAAGVALRGDGAAMALGVRHSATDADWSSEYSDLILAIKVVTDLDEALEHIRRYGSRHTDAICTSDQATADRFLASVDSAGVYLN
jgi:glutamate-5-semialdehyde dehydrogenase